MYSYLLQKVCTLVMPEGEKKLVEPVVKGGRNLPPPPTVRLGLNDLQKIGGPMPPPPAILVPASLHLIRKNWAQFKSKRI